MNDSLLSGIELGPVEKVGFTSPDGTAVEGFVIKPADFNPGQKYPLILWIHGGPIGQYSYSLHTTGQLFAANGYVVLLVNPRGSTGYGEDFTKANFGHDQYIKWYNAEFGLPWENKELWEKLSPFNDIEKITSPTLWIGGAVDWNVPIVNSEQMFLGMKTLGRETQLVVYPNEHHGIRRPSFQKDRFERFLGWYDKYLK